MVHVLKTPDYSRETVTKAVFSHLNALDVKNLCAGCKKIVLKPNLLMKRSPDLFTTTHPEVVYAVAKYFIDLGFTDITLCDSPGGPYNEAALRGIYDTTGMTAVAEELGIKLNFDFTSRQVTFPQGETCKGFEIITPLLQEDAFIVDICKAKTHCMTTLSGATKNMFGSIPGLLKPRMHYQFADVYDFCSMINDVCQCVGPDLVVVDAVIGMMGDGPSSGIECKMGYTLAGTSPFEVDVCLCRLMGFVPKDVPMVQNAIKRGLTPKEVPVMGDNLTPVNGFVAPKSKTVDFLSGFPRPIAKVARRVMRTLFTPRPKVDLQACIGCGKCAESCPPHTIEIVDRKAIINYKNCQKCYCCHEMCPISAISVSKNFLTKL